MNRERGLLAFLCTVIIVVAVFCQIPLLSGLEHLGRLFSAPEPGDLTTLGVHLSRPDAAGVNRGPGYTRPHSIADLRNDTRPDEQIHKLAMIHLIPFPTLKSFLAVTCLGVTDENGMFLPRLPSRAGPTGGDEQGDAAEASGNAGRALSHLWRQTGSLDAAILAWEVGPVRSRRVMASPEELLDRINTHLLAPYRARARDFFCAVQGLALILDARWPVSGPGAVREGVWVLLAASPGEAVRAPMPGRVRWAAPDGAMGLCVDLGHVCELATRVCGLKRISVREGDRVKAGQALGTAGTERPWFALRVGTIPRDPMLLHASGEEP